MSNIYEALLRAELERLGKSAQTDAGAPGTAEAESTLSRLQGLAAAAAASEQNAAAPASATPSAPAFTLDQVRVRPWQPSLQQLPALVKVAAGAEQFRSLRARVYEYRDFNKLKTILVCSGLPQEGKSFVAANLGLILAQQRNGKVLLIDADLRRYTLDKLLGAPHTPGLAEYLMGKADVLDVMQRCDLNSIPDEKTRAALANLTFIPAGAGGENVVDLGTSGRFKQLINTVSPAFDWVVVDSSPVNLVADAVHYARECDGVLLVVRAGTTRYEMAQRAAAEFKSGSIIGVVLNGSTDAPRAGYYGYGAETAGQ